MQCKRSPDIPLTFCCVKELFILIVIPFLSIIFYCSLTSILNVLLLELVSELLIVIESYMPGYCDMWTCLGFEYWLLLTWGILVCTAPVLHHNCSIRTSPSVDSYCLSSWFLDGAMGFVYHLENFWTEIHFWELTRFDAVLL